MKTNYADKFRKDLVEFRELTNKFYNGELRMPEYKHISGGFGSYGERAENSACCVFAIVADE